MVDLAVPAIVSSVLTKALEQQINKSINVAPAVLAKMWNNIKSNFSKHLDASYLKYSTVRTIINRDVSIKTLDIYTKTNFVSSEEFIEDLDIVERILSGTRCCITGTGGCGKSMFMKYLLLNLIENEKGKIPIFCELRHLNGLDSKDVVSFLHYSVNKNDNIVTVDVFKNVLKEGSFVIILDGFDEIDFDHRSSVERQIIELGEKYPKISLVVSSRADERFSAWSDFRIWHVQPMQLEQIVLLIGKLNYVNEVKNKFINAVKSDLYQKHQSFLSNPLLATMMLLTYDQFAHIPDKIHLFYEQAFETLFIRHDTSKQAGYQRRMYSKLAINDFKNCFSLMCVNTYSREKYTFSEAEILEYILHAVRTEGKDVEPNKFLKDLIESVCIMQREGLYISFTHRSFQEYFTAYFISRGMFKDVSPLLDSIVRRSSDSVLTMAFDMSSALIEREWILPRLIEFAREIEGFDKIEDRNRYMRIAFGDIEVSYIYASGSYRFLARSDSKWSSFCRFIYGAYIDIFKKMRKFELDGALNKNASITDEMRKLHIFPKDGLPKLKKGRKTAPPYMAKPLVADFDDAAWVNNSQLGEYADWHKEAMLRVYKLVQIRVKEKEAILGMLTFEKPA